MFVLLEITGDERIEIAPSKSGNASTVRVVTRRATLAEMMAAIKYEHRRNARERLKATALEQKIELLATGQHCPDDDDGDDSDVDEPTPLVAFDPQGAPG